MNLPGFTAEAALNTPANKYSAVAVRVPNSEVVQPQYVLPQPWTHCRWLQFSCLEFGDIASCMEWRLDCIGQ
jgi:hypothetical protein